MGVCLLDHGYGHRGGAAVGAVSAVANDTVVVGPLVSGFVVGDPFAGFALGAAVIDGRGIGSMVVSKLQL